MLWRNGKPDDWRTFRDNGVGDNTCSLPKRKSLLRTRARETVQNEIMFGAVLRGERGVLGGMPGGSLGQ